MSNDNLCKTCNHTRCYGESVCAFCGDCDWVDPIAYESELTLSLIEVANTDDTWSEQ